MRSPVSRDQWYDACRIAAAELLPEIPDWYRSRTFSGIIGDIKALPSRKALSLYTRKKGLALQYAYQYLVTGIDRGRGYQACAAAALADLLNIPIRPEIVVRQAHHERNETVRPEPVEGHKNTVIPAQAGIHSVRTVGTEHCFVSPVEGLAQGTVLDVGCAVGVTAGVLELEKVVGFDLFIDLVRTARMVDRIAGKQNRYLVADMMRDWPFGVERFDAVVCGLVCHHLKTQAEVAGFFRNANRVLKEGGLLALTLPAGSIATVRVFRQFCNGLGSFGFDIDEAATGLTFSTDDPESLFWMFPVCAVKRGESVSDVFVDNSFSFREIRTPVTREEKAGKARTTAGSARHAIHRRFALLDMQHFADTMGVDEPLVFEHVNEMADHAAKKE